MDRFEFNIIVADVEAITEDMANSLFEAGADDCTPFSRGQVVGLAFRREAANLGDAIDSAVQCVKKAGLRVKRIAGKAGDGHLDRT